MHGISQSYMYMHKYTHMRTCTHTYTQLCMLLRERTMLTCDSPLSLYFDIIILNIFMCKNRVVNYGTVSGRKINY